MDKEKVVNELKMLGSQVIITFCDIVKEIVDICSQKSFQNGVVKILKIIFKIILIVLAGILRLILSIIVPVFAIVWTMLSGVSMFICGFCGLGVIFYGYELLKTGINDVTLTMFGAGVFFCWLFSPYGIPKIGVYILAALGIIDSLLGGNGFEDLFSE